MKPLLAALLLSLALRVSAQDPPTPLGTVKEGVYFLNGSMQTTIVELKDGKFRYWFSSDAKFPGEPSYPQTGNYTTNGGTVKFVVNIGSWKQITSSNPTTGEMSFGGSIPPGFVGVTTNWHESFVTNEWTFLNYKGQPTLWGPFGLKDSKPPKSEDGYNVLYPTDRKPEEIWEHKGWQPAKKSSP